MNLFTYRFREPLINELVPDFVVKDFEWRRIHSCYLQAGNISRIEIDNYYIYKFFWIVTQRLLLFFFLLHLINYLMFNLFIISSNEENNSHNEGISFFFLNEIMVLSIIYNLI